MHTEETGLPTFTERGRWRTVFLDDYISKGWLLDLKEAIYLPVKLARGRENTYISKRQEKKITIKSFLK